MFSSGKKSSGSAPPRSAGKSGTGGLSFIGPDVVISGDVTSSAQVHIDGRVDGNVRCETLVQGDGGTIAGHIQADTAHLSGLVDGTVKARLVTLEPSARITGDVTYETLSIAAGATIEGRLARKEAGSAGDPLVKRPSAEKAARPGKPEEPSLLAVGSPPAVAANG